MEYKLLIKKFRIIRGMTQAELARKANVRQSYISQLEKDCKKVKSPTLNVLFRISAALEVCPYALIEFNSPCNKNCGLTCERFF